MCDGGYLGECEHVGKAGAPFKRSRCVSLTIASLGLKALALAYPPSDRKSIYRFIANPPWPYMAWGFAIS